ncbi:DNA alkylation repair protein [Leptotrichia sp. oral taxon 847]|uniref:DNA alkylation repair protein n=1 Tax=Leptotrichia sp. oral taxon 847 TaxID=1785996 RepID=UPI0007684871|nr:DNA alkylation repair protein [Leptotrichia sp. oral taxon 847]AMD95948.1 DNA alkylation repair protein [Leptotrichia sp. oral taxon 847]
MEIQKELFLLQDKEYAKFSNKLSPNVAQDTIIGVRIPEIRKLAKKLIKNNEYQDFLKELPHKYYDENLLHGAIISDIKNFDNCIELLDIFLPFIDNWAVCDTISPKIFKKNKVELIKKIKEWTNSDKTYICRFGIEMLMTHFLNEDFKKEYLEMVANIHSKEYYVNMVISWFFATALAKQWDSTVVYLENDKLDVWVHNKTIQKARESFRITKEQKDYLKGLKR